MITPGLRRLTDATLVVVLAGCGWLPDRGLGCGEAPTEVATVDEIIATESVITYADGRTRIGVFFEDEHRQALTYDQLPAAWMVAIVAAEDGGFWEHRGVDPKHVARAARDNALARKVVSGGSTLSQQAAKNLFSRPAGRSLASKWQELDYAMHLEKTYSKHEILTFYANQFHVTGNGRGLAIASRYFFDTEPSDLSLVQAAFIAGMVKGPAHYDPFRGDAGQREQALNRAVERTRYVLDRITTESIERLLPRPTEGRVIEPDVVADLQAAAGRLLERPLEVPFRRGSFRYDTSVILDEVNRRLEQPPFASILVDAGLPDPETAGLTVVTTLDVDVQREATYGLWHHLTEVGAWMEAPTAADFLTAAPGDQAPDPFRPPARHTFRHGVVDGQDDRGILVDLRGHPCLVDRTGVVRAAVAAHRGARGHARATMSTEQVDAFAEAFEPGAGVWVSVRQGPDEQGLSSCDLERRPELQGASVVLHNGRLLAMVGGNDNRHFNRATAPRQLGSVFKPVVFHAALNLGWNPDDPLDNRRSVFPYSGGRYAPRPAHEPEPWVSMAWAGALSENLASVWLLFHLLDKVDPGGVGQLAGQQGLWPTAQETREDYQRRLQGEGVLPLRERLPEAAFLAARNAELWNLDPQGTAEVITLLHGWGLPRTGGDGWQELARERTLRHLIDRRESCDEATRLLASALASGSVPPLADLTDVTARRDESGLLAACGRPPEGYRSLRAVLTDEVRGVPRRQWKRALRIPFEPHRTRVDDAIELGTLEQIERSMTRRALLDEAIEVDLYDPDLLVWHQDLRTLIAMRYVIDMARAYGVETPIEPVLSLPLGATEITLEEAARLYAGLVSGDSWHPVGRDATGARVRVASSPTQLIERIVGPDGTVLYQATPTTVRVADPEIGEMTAHILHNTIEHGTGTAALGAADDGRGPIPLGGKTGTTDDYRNAAFVGFAAGPGARGYEARLGPIVAVYVGYDDNRSMRNGSIKLSGAQGALPAWTDAVRGAVAAAAEPAPDGAPEDGAWDLEHSHELVLVEVDPATGLPVDPTDDTGEPMPTATVLTRRDWGRHIRP